MIYSANQLLKFYRGAAPSVPGFVSMDWTSTSTLKKGTMFYSWNSCGNGTTNCVHFVQMHNYPSYTMNQSYSGATYNITDGLGSLAAGGWLATDLNSTLLPVVFNFHDFGGFLDSASKVG